MSIRSLLSLTTIAIACGLAVVPDKVWSDPSPRARKMLEVETMVGVPRPFADLNPAVRAQNAIRGIQGGGLPWVIGDAHGTLRADGELDLRVRGLVFDPKDPQVIERGLAGRNTVPAFKAIVSCITVGTDGMPAVVNLETGLFPADEAGNALIRDQVMLPSPCIAPIIFVTSPTGAWFAATGF